MTVEYVAAAKRVVHLNRVKLGGVKAQESAQRQIGGVELGVSTTNTPILKCQCKPSHIEGFTVAVACCLGGAKAAVAEAWACGPIRREGDTFRWVAVKWNMMESCDGDPNSARFLQSNSHLPG